MVTRTASSTNDYCTSVFILFAFAVSATTHTVASLFSAAFILVVGLPFSTFLVKNVLSQLLGAPTNFCFVVVPFALQCFLGEAYFHNAGMHDCPRPCFPQAGHPDLLRFGLGA